jgi:hypothetical protein
MQVTRSNTKGVTALPPKENLDPRFPVPHPSRRRPLPAGGRPGREAAPIPDPGPDRDQ